MAVHTDRLLLDRPEAERQDLTIRVRIRNDLDELRKRYLPEMSPTISTRCADYPYRATCTHAALAQAMLAILTDVTYPNFKASVMREQGVERERVYSRVWAALADGLPPLDEKHDEPSLVMPRVVRSKPRRPAPSAQPNRARRQ